MTVSEQLKYTFKLTVSHVLYAMGLLQLWQSIALRRKAVVLMYHRVLTSEERTRTGSHPGIVVDRETFARQMAVLKRRFVVLPIDEFARRMEGLIPFEDSSCLITFDDGWNDNFTHAMPILQHHRLPAVVFLPVNFIGGRRVFWQEQLTHLVYQAVMAVRNEPRRREQFRESLAAVRLDFLLDLPDLDPRPAIMEAVRQQKGLAAPVIEGSIVALANVLGIRLDEIDGTDGFLDWEQVENMSRQGIAFGGHGAEHRLLTLVSTSEARDEIRKAKDVIDSHLQKRTLTFSYPNGNWSPAVVNLVKESGYRMAFTTQTGHVGCGDDRFTVRRVNISEDVTSSTPMFMARIVGLF